MNKRYITICSVFCCFFLAIAGCNSLVNSNDLAFLTSLKEFHNESISTIGKINEKISAKDYEGVKSDIKSLQEKTDTEISTLSAMQVSEKFSPIKNNAILALEQQKNAIQQVNSTISANKTVVTGIAQDYLKSVIDSSVSGLIGGK